MFLVFYLLGCSAMQALLALSMYILALSLFIKHGSILGNKMDVRSTYTICVMYTYMFMYVYIPLLNHPFC